MKARILENNEVKLYTLDYFDLYPDLVIGWDLVELTDEQVLFIQECKLPKYIDGIFIDGFIEVVQVPKEISRMKFIIQIYLTTGIMYEDIVLFIQNLTFDEAQKYVILTRLRSATHFDRNSSDLGMIAQMMGITSEQLDEIFINGNLLN